MDGIVTRQSIKMFIKYHFKRNPAHGPIRAENILGVYDLGFDLDKYYQEISKYKKVFKQTEIGKITYRKKTYPVYKIKTKNKAPKKLLIL